MEEAGKKFIKHAESDYYAEWFWFPLQREAWVNTWNTGKKEEAINSPSEFETFLQWLEEWFGQLLNEWPVWQLLEGDLQAKLTGFLTLLLFPNIKENEPPGNFPSSSSTLTQVTTQLINGLEFGRGIQNLQPWDMEWSIALPPRPDNETKPDWSIAHKSMVGCNPSYGGKPHSRSYYVGDACYGEK